ncbi:MAG: NADH-quinone oxidoreductase subunit C/D, partial [Pseudohongiellaceae bacterium]
MSKVSEQVSQETGEQMPAVISALYQKFGESSFVRQHTAESMPTLWLGRDKLLEVLAYLKSEYIPRFEMLLDVTAIDERVRVNRAGQPDSDFTVVYHLISFSGNCDIRLKVALSEADQNIPTIIPLWPAANWHEREMWDMFGINVTGHPNLSRIY